MCLNKVKYVIISLLVMAPMLLATEYYVATDGDDTNPGTISAPFATLEHAFIDVAGPGDHIYIREGVYHEEVVTSSKTGPITISNYADEEVTLDGSRALSDLGGVTWTQEPGTNIYQTTLDQDVWQLWVDGRMMIPARWPNVLVGHPCDPIQFQEDEYTPIAGSWWDWEGTWGHMVNTWNAGGNLTNNSNFHNLAAEGVSFEGGSIILNFHSESTFSRNILSHSAGSNDLIHEPVMNPHDQRQGQFMIEANSALDIPGEWYYDNTTGVVRVWCEDGASPEGRNIRGKTISYAISVNEMDFITIRGINFFGCTVNSPNGHHVTVEDCNFSYPTWYRRMLGEHSYAGEPEQAAASAIHEGTTVLDGSTSTSSGTFTTLRNCVFEYSDGMVWMKSGYGILIDNCLFHHFSFTGMAQMALMANSNKNSLMTNCTFHTNGSKVMVKHTSMDVTMCRFSKFGYFQYDGCAMQCAGGDGPGGGSDGRIRSYNWHFQAFKTGCRWDGSSGVNGTDHHFVSWKVPASMQIKGDYHHVINNTSLEIQSDGEPGIKVLTPAGTDNNSHSNVHNNLAQAISSDRQIYVPLTGNESHNWNGYVTEENASLQVRDVHNFDFRPRFDSDLIDAGVMYDSITAGFVGDAPDIGAYEYGDVNYWIPGYQYSHASTPIPPHESNMVMTDADLMWLKGREATSYRVYFGLSPSNLVQVSTQANNIYEPGLLEESEYFWRVDCVTPAGVVTGETWSFLVGEPSTGTGDSGILPFRFKLQNNYPNPFNPKTRISFSIPEMDMTSLTLFNIQGRYIRTLISEELGRGEHKFDLYAEDLASGVYFIQLESGDSRAVQKCMLIK
ncbi:MAG: T9SS type A sorting domain-containing protein [Candidatus Marinimicrobia bacterium]|jgi:hypothetical protein|nr:T9SS type A sorting domain-containing protein [Candidatus Neomarinimicrobiota bacterium]MBT3823595.1 T9SS type A sorting domain-containing protein [Candidatus Neomarinimicrobiota bacterium]MBT4295928.1 T9SS type A sorting domain-containing protein [Candidatus Neomarinimicrobiota bacterium]MBT4994261.1 T9SS type A sorting domain-containing protein [Candidatus Neomarinimicrobiota bacterium]MBT5236345.1 T9SS type A sorting domain-containing protein [Candidatus Neomarinimicrobiota bacterium]